MTDSQFASDLQALDCKLRNETDPTEFEALKGDMRHLRHGLRGPFSKRLFGRHIKVRAKTYKPPQAKWLAAARAGA